MSQQEIIVGSGGADSRRVLDALTPINGVAAPAINATFLGQLYIDTVAPAVYVSVAVGSEVKAEDWKNLDSLAPATGILAPAINATFIGQLYIDTVAMAIYVSVAVGSIEKSGRLEKSRFACTRDWYCCPSHKRHFLRTTVY